MTKEEIKRANEKYIENKNSHKLLGTEECLASVIPHELTPQKAMMIKKEIDQYAIKQYQDFFNYFDSLANQHESPEKRDVSEMRRLQVLDQTTIFQYDDLENANDSERLMIIS